MVEHDSSQQFLVIFEGNRWQTLISILDNYSAFQILLLCSYAHYMWGTKKSPRTLATATLWPKSSGTCFLKGQGYYTSFLLMVLLGFNCTPNRSGNTYSYSFQEIWELLGGEMTSLLFFFCRFFRPPNNPNNPWVGRFHEPRYVLRSDVVFEH